MRDLKEFSEALTFDDVLIKPGYSEFSPANVVIRTSLTEEISLEVPLLSAAMDTVTEAPLAIALAQEGGLGVVHRNMEIEKQVEHVRRVKKFESGVIMDPITVSPDISVKEAIETTNKYGISGLPVVVGECLVGIVTRRDLRFVANLDDPVTSVMTPREKLVTVSENATRFQIECALHEHRLERVLVVNKDFELCGMVTVKDIRKSTEHPLASKDASGRLRVGAAVGTGEEACRRVASLIESGVDVIFIDTAHGHSKMVLDTVRELRETYSDMQLVVGNIATEEAAVALATLGVDAVKVGIGPGSICTTRVVSGIGVPQITAIRDVSHALKNEKIRVISDGGVRFSGDAAKAIAAGAHSIMIGGLFAGTQEAPGLVDTHQGRAYKAYRGMGSVAAMLSGSSSRYFQDARVGAKKLVPEGVEGRVPYRGPLKDVVHNLVGGIRAGLGYAGCADIEAMRRRCGFIRVTQAGLEEGHVHGVDITHEAPNYPFD